VFRTDHVMCAFICADGRDDVAQQRGDIAVCQQRRNGAHDQQFRRQPREFEAGLLPVVLRCQDRVNLVVLQCNRQGLEQYLRVLAPRGVVRLELLVQHTLVTRVHVDEYEPRRVLREDVDAVQLRERGAQRPLAVRGGAG